MRALRDPPDAGRPRTEREALELADVDRAVRTHGHGRRHSLRRDRLGSLCGVDPELLTAIQDIKFRPSGALLVLELAEGGTGAFEAGCFGPDGCPPGVLLHVGNSGNRHEIAPGAIQGGAGGVTVGRFGYIYVTDGTFGDGRLLRISPEAAAPPAST